MRHPPSPGARAHVDTSFSVRIEPLDAEAAQWVVASSRTTGLCAESESPMSEIVATLLAERLTPRTWVKMVEPGLKPSLCSRGVGSKADPPTAAGKAPGGKNTHRPVGMDGSLTV